MTSNQITSSKLAHTLCDILFEDADMLGEVLLRYAFVGEGRGCYSNFELRPSFRLFSAGKDGFSDHLVGHPDIYSVEEFEEEVNKISSYLDAELGLAVIWDWSSGDGHLIFQLEDTILKNTDIKKSYGWRFIDTQK